MKKLFSIIKIFYISSLLCLTTFSGCVSPVALHRAVLEYDWTVNRIETELLLLNIARTRYHVDWFDGFRSVCHGGYRLHAPHLVDLVDTTKVGRG